jgi:guanylate kinase
MAQASNEMSHWPEYDYIVVNSDLDESVAKVQSVLAAERIKRDRQIGLGDFVKRLRDGR